ncbi:uncharacterized protein MKK02DRAFT_32950 [Dioszegia hungarica]|uniref:Thioredoxin-like fold domain-containing protein n=1 Tax=Dioszegia hungarica TaxID=4972 RepID=A0AA38H766_9TREE|nr:uncharacterized protein MKK02DRAFT_32950 [Dioszegia hungarica]KAI9635560.1 hypothetical protein MKK02DRAFT_32950 [Dioszegia hungarica]
MAVPRSLAFLKQGTGSQVLETYLDPLCPFSAKMARSLTANVLPLLRKGGEYEGQLSVVTWIYPQPFHYVSPVVTEALLVFGTHHPELFWDYLTVVFENQSKYFNVPAASLTADQIRDGLTDLALSVLEKSGKLGQGPKSQAYGEFRKRIGVVEQDGGMNKGTEAFEGMKHIIKIGRQNSIHVTPTTLFDGLVDNSISSGWGKEDWTKYLK